MGLLEEINTALRLGDLDQAIVLLTAFPVENSQLAEAAKSVVEALLQAGRGDAAEQLARSETIRRPKDPKAYSLHGTVLASLGRPEEATEAFGMVYHWIPTDAVAAATYVEGLRRIGDRSTADAVEAEHRTLLEQSIERLPPWQSDRSKSARNAVGAARQLYLDLLERAVANVIYQDNYNVFGTLKPFEAARREQGKDIPSEAHSMIGLKRLRQIREAACQVIEEGIPGDFIETGVWRGGACILLRGVLAAYGDKSRRVWAADSFEGLPPPDPRFPKDAATRFDFHTRPELSVSLENVKENFARYGLLDDQVVFLKGFFCDTLPGIANEKFSLLRLDGDLYSSTTDALTYLYDKLSPAGFVIIDDYGAVIDARRATLDFRSGRGITDQIYSIDQDGVFWRKGEHPRTFSAWLRKWSN
jgi:hypothetical protein